MANGNFGGGSGTELAPYLVEDGEDLKAIMTLEGSNGMHFAQVSNINLSNYKSEIYNLNVKSYNGGDFQISNLEIIQANIADITGITSLSLFNLSGDSLLNINLIDVFVDTSTMAYTSSLLQATSTNIRVSNCHASGLVSSAGGATGGLVSSSSNSCSFKDCSFSGIVSGAGESGTGGFICKPGAGVSFENCSSSGEVSGERNSGGFVGDASSNRQLYRGCYAMCSVTGTNHVGGFAGNLGGSDTLVTSCKVDSGTPDLVGLKIIGSSNVGGFAGNTGGGCIVRYVSSIVSGVTGDSYTGGFTGRISLSTIHDVECYGGYVFGSNRVGGFAGAIDGYSGTIGTLTNIISRGVEIEGSSRVGGIAGETGGLARFSWCYMYYSRIIRNSGTSTLFYDLCPSWDTVDQVEGGSGFVVEYLTFYDRA